MMTTYELLWEAPAPPEIEESTEPTPLATGYQLGFGVVLGVLAAVAIVAGGVALALVVVAHQADIVTLAGLLAGLVRQAL
jgi:hypothetical protein